MGKILIGRTLDVSTDSLRAAIIDLGQQAFAAVHSVTVAHGLGLFPPTIRVLAQPAQVGAYGVGGYGGNGFGGAGAAVPQTALRETFDFLLFYLDENSFLVAFPDSKTGFVIYR